MIQASLSGENATELLQISTFSLGLNTNLYIVTLRDRRVISLNLTTLQTTTHFHGSNIQDVIEYNNTFYWIERTLIRSAPVTAVDDVTQLYLDGGNTFLNIQVVHPDLQPR